MSSEHLPIEESLPQTACVGSLEHHEHTVPPSTIFETPPSDSHDDHFHLKQKLKNHLVLNTGETINTNSITFTGPTCDKCLRKSTESYDIGVCTYDSSELHIKNRKFGQKLPSTGRISLCTSCITYTTTDARSFKTAWPSILSSYWVSEDKDEAILEKIISLLPCTILEMYCHSMEKYSQVFKSVLERTKLVVADRTSDRSLLLRNNVELKGADLKRNYDKFPLPDVVCPWGCWDFVEKCQTLSFECFLANIDPDFRNSNHKESLLKGVTSNFPQGFTLLQKFEITPAVIIEDDGHFAYLSCSKHSGETLQYLHPPRNPILSSVSPNKPERLAVTQQQMNIVKTGKPKFNSHSSHLIEERGSFTGISSSTLQFPTFLESSTLLDDLSEFVISKGRSDVYPLIEYFLENHIVDQNFTDFLFNSTLNLTSHEIAEAIANSTNVSLYDAFKLQMHLNGNHDNDELQISFPVYAHNLGKKSDYGCVPPCLFKTGTIAKVFEGLVRFTASFLPSLRNSETDALRQLSQSFCNLLFLTGSTKSAINEAKAKVLSITENITDHLSDNSSSVNSFFEYLVAANLAAFKVPSRSFTSIPPTTTNSVEGPLFVFAPTRSERDCDIPMDTLTHNLETYQLVFLSKNFWKAEFYCRHQRENSAWFESFSCLNSFSETSFGNFYDFAAKGTWDIAVYEKLETSDSQKILRTFLNSIGAQDNLSCERHNCLLIQKNPLDTLTCFNILCRKKAKWVCPKVDCNTGVCKHHSEELINESSRCAITSKKERTDPLFTDNFEDQNDPTLDNQTNFEPNNLQQHELNLIFEPENYLTMSVDTSDQTLPFSSNSGVPSISYFIKETHTNRVPTKVLLNNYLNVLQRTKVPLWTTNAHKNFLQSIVSRIPNTSVPLLYPEALLFPSIFWKQQEDGSFPGALPSCLLQSDELNTKLGFATVSKHLWNRLTNGSLLTSTSTGYASFAFDIKMNQELNRSHSNFIVFKRGFEDYLGADEALKLPNCAIKWDGLDSSKRVQEVAAACAEESPHYFFTLTCSMAGQFGVRPLFEAINELYANENRDVYEAVVQSFMGMFVRMWERMSSVVMGYIEKSSERPLGEVLRIWWRYEFQTSQGNLPHIHCLLWVNELKSSECFQNRVVLKKCQLLFSLEDTFLKTIGLVKDTDHAFSLYKDAVKIHYHSCAATNFRCHKRTNENGQSFCRYPVYPTSAEYHLEEVDVNHSDETFHVLSLCQLAKEKIGYVDTMCVTEELKAGQWFYPSQKNQNVTPMNPHLFVLTESQNNLLICDKYLSARYIAKYAAGAEEKANVSITAGKKENELHVDVGSIENNKIASVQHRLRKEEQQQRKRSCQAKHICITECYWHLFDLPFVRSSFSSVCLNTNEMENRPGVKLTHQRRRLSTHSENQFTSPLITVRDQFPNWRQFTESQKRIIQLHCESNISVSNITAHSARPPELLFIKNPRKYFWLLSRETIKKPTTSQLCQLLRSNKMIWIDGFGKQILVRRNRVPQFLEILQNSTEESATSLRAAIETEADMASLTSKILDSRSNVVVYFSKIYPSDAGKFLIHLLLSMGEFETELDLFNCTSLLDSFKKAGLWSESSVRQNILKLTKKYILEEAQFLPGSTRMFNKNVVQCFQTLTEFFENGSIDYVELPRVLLSSVQAAVDDKVEVFLKQTRVNIAKGLIASGKVPNCPSELQIAQATTATCVPFSPTLATLPTQTATSYGKQKTFLDQFINAIDQYLSGSKVFVPHHFALGKPGTGKSTITLVATCYAMCKGLCCMITTLAGEKAAQFGGMHLHRLIPIPVKTSLPVMKQVESTVQRLYHDPLRLTFLKRLDVLVIEEVGMLNSEQWSVLDHTLRFVNNSNVPMGGILVLGNGDPKQLRPPSGPLLWISPILYTNFRLFYLAEYVRMIDPLGARLLTLLDRLEVSDAEAEEIVDILSNNSTFVEKWSDIRNDEAILRVVPTKQAEKKLVNEKYNLIRSTNNNHLTFNSTDEVSRRGQNLWSKTEDANCITHLNRNCLEPNSLLIYEGAPMRITRNIQDLLVTQGQLCVIRQVPDADSTSLDLFVAPPCVRSLPPVQPDGSRNFELSGWRTVSVRRMEGLPQNFRNHSSLRRTQFPLKPFQASTIHKCIGDDVPLLATQIATTDPFERKMFKLWEKNQLLVLVSRVKELKDLTFVGSKSATLKTIKDIATSTSQWDYFVHEFVEALSQQDLSKPLATFPVSQHIYSMSCQSVPQDSCATVFCLMSLKDGTIAVAACTNIRKTLQQKNSFDITENTLTGNKKPWALLCAAFHPTVSALDDSVRALECHWNNSLPHDEKPDPPKIVRLLQETTLSFTCFYQTINFVSFVHP